MHYFMHCMKHCCFKNNAKQDKLSANQFFFRTFDNGKLLGIFNPH